MPLADMGLVRRFDMDDTGAAAPAAQSRRRPTDRMLRCVAGFYGDARDLEAVAAVMRSRFGLRDDQVSVVRPDRLRQDSFKQVARRWRSLRPAQRLGSLLSKIALGTLTGLVSGGLAGAVVGSLAQLADPSIDALAWLLPGLIAGALAGGVTAALLAGRRAMHRFDDTVARKLGSGYGVVVAHGLEERHEAPVLAYLQGTSHSWCAEAPRRC